MEKLERAKKPAGLPVVLDELEVRQLMANLDGRNWLMASLLYGAGLRLMECVRLRVKDVDFQYRQITVRDGKGGKDRVTMLPESSIEPLQQHLKRINVLHAQDIAAVYAGVYLPFALERKYRAANRQCDWQYALPPNTR